MVSSDIWPHAGQVRAQSVLMSAMASHYQRRDEGEERPTEGAGARLRPAGGLPSKESTQNPMGRLGRMDELADLAAFVMAPNCEWLTGQTIDIDGANWLANGAYFTQYMAWGDAEWDEARARIKEHNDRDKAQRSS